jgi:hypothetical protein
MRQDHPILTSNLRLTPPERWFASWALKRQATHRNPTVARLETDYGPQGIAVMAAGFALFFVGWIIVMTGIGFLIASSGRDAFSYYLIYAGVVFEIAVVLRCVQGTRVARRHRVGNHS